MQSFLNATVVVYVFPHRIIPQMCKQACQGTDARPDLSFDLDIVLVYSIDLDINQNMA